MSVVCRLQGNTLQVVVVVVVFNFHPIYHLQIWNINEMDVAVAELESSVFQRKTTSKA
jgi:hypothetical protein